MNITASGPRDASLTEDFNDVAAAAAPTPPALEVPAPAAPEADPEVVAGGTPAPEGVLEGSPSPDVAGGAVTMLRVVVEPAGCEIETVAFPAPVEEALVDAEPLAGVDDDPPTPAPPAPPPPPADAAGTAAALVLLPPVPVALPAPGEDVADAPPEGAAADVVVVVPGAFVPAKALLISVAA